LTCRDEFAPDCPSREESANFRSPGTHYIATDHTAPLAGVTYRPIAAMPALRAWQATYSWPFKITWAGKGGCPWFATMALLGIWARHPSVAGGTVMDEAVSVKHGREAVAGHAVPADEKPSSIRFYMSSIAIA